MLIGSGNLLDNHVYEVIDPVWYRVDRWLVWLWVSCKRSPWDYVMVQGRRVRVRRWTKRAATR